MNPNFKSKSAVKIRVTEQKIKEYKEKYPQRN